MKMSELITEKSPIDKAKQARKLAGAAGDLAGATWDWTVGQAKKLDPRQFWNKDVKTTFTSADKDPGGVLAKHADDLAAAEKAQAKNAIQQARIDKADARIEKLDKIRDKLELRRNVDPNKLAKLDKVNAKLDNIKQAAIDKKVDVPKVDRPEPTSQSVGRFLPPLAGADYFFSDPGDSVVSQAAGYLGGKMSQIPDAAATGFSQARSEKKEPAEEPVVAYSDDQVPQNSAQTDKAPPRPEAKESASEILKLAGLRPITERDNIAGIIRPKEIMALHESTQLDECGIMPSAPNQTASLSINATAGNGQEVANMLAAIMNLAGVKPVSGDMLGTSAMPPMPIVKAIDIISRGDSDSMNSGHHDHDDKETLTGSMEEEYGNTPENPTDVPDLDTNAHAHQPNAVDVGDRMDGTMPKGFPQVTQESLLQAYNQFKNGQ